MPTLKGLIDDFKTTWRQASERSAEKRANAQPVIPAGGFGAKMAPMADILKPLAEPLTSFLGAQQTTPQVLPTIARPPQATPAPTAPAAAPVAPTAPTVNQQQSAAMQLLQNPRYQGVLQRPDGDPLKSEFLAELAKQTNGATPAGVADPAYIGTPQASDTEQSILEQRMTQTEGALNTYNQEAPTFATTFRKGLKDKGYDLDQGLNQIAEDRSELMRAMSKGTISTRDFSKIGAIAARMADSIANQEKMERKVKEETDSALAFFEQSGVIKKQDAEKASKALSDYFERRGDELKQSLEIAKITGFFQGQPTLEREKFNADQAGSGAAGLSKRQQSFLSDAYTLVQKLGTGEYVWGTAFNALRAKYPEATDTEVDQVLQKNEYYPK